jgi:hypothetical protein
MTIPSLFFGILISTIYGAAFHLWRGGGAGRLALYLILAWIGFWVGHFAAGRLGWTFGSVGALHLGLASLASLVTLGVGYWLSLVDTK